MNYKLKVLWSESEEFEANEEYSIRELQNKTFRIDSRLFNSPKDEFTHSYKLHFRLEFTDNFIDEVRVYEGRQDLGNGIGGFIDHMENVGINSVEPGLTSNSDFILNILVPKLRRQYQKESKHPSSISKNT